MIRYALGCDNGHEFEAWFRGFEDFERQRDAGLVACPACGTLHVEKKLMTPAVATSRAREARTGHQVAAAAEAGVAGSGPAGPVVTGSQPQARTEPVATATVPGQAELIARLRALRAQVTANAVDVGEAFPEEARKIHYGEKEARGIYGAASREEVRELLDEGVAVMPLPVLPEDRN
ncbi:DUF1178 family protein [Stappia sp. MMSF_3263]|uniref:DUF1178 family protein n=1 Tax=Stappia sp. MMSF_3263 TaxID=3046693 RepID=UPI00273E62B6|nr:DUF1178 family protein [Stappia sp. MMSF_3263]